MIAEKIFMGFGLFGAGLFIFVVEFFITAAGFSIFRSITGYEFDDFNTPAEIFIGFVVGNLFVVLAVSTLYLLGSIAYNFLG